MMMKPAGPKFYVFFILCFFPVAYTLHAQQDNAALLAQSVDGKTVKLFWFIKSWNSSYTGFDIKRKEGLENWVKINSAPILPGISSKKKLSVCGNNLYEESLLKAKLYKLLKSRSLQETEYTKYLQKLNSDQSELWDMTKVMAEDYDIALMNGFGYIDHTPTHKTVYQYGLFIQGTDQLLAKVFWNYGEIPDLDVVKELTSKKMPGATGVKIMWNADTAKMRKSHIAGFNIYRSGIRLNETRITQEEISDPTWYTWVDKNAPNNNQIQYSIAAESIFNIEGIIRSYAYDPADHPGEYAKCEVTQVSSLGFYFKDGTSISWNFPKDYEKYISGFYVEKDNTPNGYQTVSGLLDPSTRSFTDKTQSQVNGYIKARVKVLFKDRSLVPGVERLFCYFPVTEPPVPQDVKVKSISGDKKVTAYISWDAPIPGDSTTDYYKVYCLDDNNKNFALVSGERLKATNFTYVFNHGLAGVHRFCITAANKLNTESSFSDTVEVQTPSFELPAPVIKKVIPDNTNKATIEWQFPDIIDLKGFRLFQNSKVIANETEIRKNTRQYETSKLEEGASYEFTIQAVSETGVVSENSASFHVVVNQTNK